MIPTSEHNEALSGDVLYSAFLNHQWREIVIPFILIGMEQLAAGIGDETERQTFEVRYGALIDDLYNGEIVDGTPVGTIVAFAGGLGSIPEKWRVCDGEVLPEAVFAELAVAMTGTAFYSSPNITLPDLRDKFIYGATLTADVGVSGGSETHTLTIDEMPAHNHTTPSSSAVGGTTGRVAHGSATALGNPATSSVGSSEAHNNMPPFLLLFYIIKVLP